MINHHPNHNILLEYTSGSLDIASSIAVKTHLHFCCKCSHNVAQLEQIGGECLSSLAPEPITEDFDNLMHKIEATPQEQLILPESTASEPTHNSHYYELPNIVQRLVPKFAELRWKRLNGSLSVARLTTGQTTHEVALHRITAGGKVPNHGHKGNEITVVLRGSFSDEDGIYQQGDFISLNQSHSHRPMAAKNVDCLCLSVLDAPVRLTGLLGKILNPFMKTYAA